MSNVAVLVASSLLLPATSAASEPVLLDDVGGRDNSDGYTFEVVDEKPGTPGEVTAVDGGDDERTPLFVMSYPVLGTDPTTGEDCTRRRYVVGYDETARGPAADTVRLEEAAFQAAVGDPPPPDCGGLIIDEGEVAQTASELVADELDPAAPYLQPDNRAITGLRSFLTTNLDSQRTETVQVSLFGRDWDVEVRVEGVHTVDWGDGTIDTGITSDGGPWHEGPEGADDIVHTYLETGTYDLVVTTEWTVTASLPATGVSASQTLATTSSPVAVDVDEVRSARDR